MNLNFHIGQLKLKVGENHMLLLNTLKILTYIKVLLISFNIRLIETFNQIFKKNKSKFKTVLMGIINL